MCWKVFFRLLCFERVLCSAHFLLDKLAEALTFLNLTKEVFSSLEKILRRIPSLVFISDGLIEGKGHSTISVATPVLFSVVIC